MRTRARASPDQIENAKEVSMYDVHTVLGSF